MNGPNSGAEAGNAVDVANTRAVLQQAVEHYPRLVAFSFTLDMGFNLCKRMQNGADDES